MANKGLLHLQSEKRPMLYRLQGFSTVAGKETSPSGLIGAIMLLGMFMSSEMPQPAILKVDWCGLVGVYYICCLQISIAQVTST
ncbi:hypothetical protein SAY87_009753 [Trapa incisa]|uniref:Uncharacterized protein n=1 Tax=Trapa incisa TaxID=236973 RepID=A0AAN7JY59_9MYRT|nr:hypothetical protein SAY87_009753 [Trapa incisa]